MEVVKISNIHIVIGLGYGDEGKGSIVDYLVRQHNAHTVVRFNGGSQAAHTNISPEGVVHVCSQFGSGILVPGVKTLLSRFMLIDPLAIESESDVLKGKGISDCLERLMIDDDCIIITPFHKIINRMIEISLGDSKHGSCGMGVGQAVMDSDKLGNRMLFAKDLLIKPLMKQKLNFLWASKLDLAKQLMDEHPDNELLKSYFDKLNQLDYVKVLTEKYYGFARNSGVQISEDFLNRILAKEENVIFEGAQGALLDKDRGFWPYVTPTCTTFENADKLISQTDYSGKITKVGVLRSYSTRHGVGPFVTENSELTKLIPDEHNGFNDWQESFRIGWFDLIATKYALNIAGDVDYVALTNLDRLFSVKQIPVCVLYDFYGLEVNLDKFFKSFKNLNGDTLISDILVTKDSNQKHQSQLAKLLGMCKPVYYQKNKVFKMREYVKFLEKELNISIPLISVGPTANEKIQTLNP